MGQDKYLIAIMDAQKLMYALSIEILTLKVKVTKSREKCKYL